MAQFDPDARPEVHIPLTAAGGWCAPSDALYMGLPGVGVSRGGITYGTPSAEQMAALAELRHRNRWKRRRAFVKGWVTLRTPRYRIHNWIHRDCY